MRLPKDRLGRHGDGLIGGRRENGEMGVRADGKTGRPRRSESQSRPRNEVK